MAAWATVGCLGGAALRHFRSSPIRLPTISWWMVLAGILVVGLVLVAAIRSEWVRSRLRRAFAMMKVLGETRPDAPKLFAAYVYYVLMGSSTARP